MEEEIAQVIKGTQEVASEAMIVTGKENLMSAPKTDAQQDSTACHLIQGREAGPR